MDSVRNFGLGLIRSGHGSNAEIQKALNQLEEAKATLNQAWLHRNMTLEQACLLQVTIRSHLGYIHTALFLTNPQTSGFLGSSTSAGFM